MKHFSFFQLGLRSVMLALSLMLFSCADSTKNPTTPTEPDESGITSVTFKVSVTKLRESAATQGKIIGSFTDITGGVPPYHYSFLVGDGLNDADNDLFAFDQYRNVIITADSLAKTTYRFLLGVTDSKNNTSEIPVTIVVHGEPVNGEQDLFEINGIVFAMRFVKGEIFKIDDTVSTLYFPDFFIMETEVTQELFMELMGNNPSHYKKNPAPGEIQGQRPAEGMNYFDAMLFCNRLSKITGKDPVYKYNGMYDNWGLTDADYLNVNYDAFKRLPLQNGFRMPTVNEWLWASIGGKEGNTNNEGYKKRFSGGAPGSWEAVGDYAWFNENSGSITHEVGKKLPNELHLYDMTGNVQEFVDVLGSAGLHGLNGKDETTGNEAYYLPKIIYGELRPGHIAPCGIRLIITPNP